MTEIARRPTPLVWLQTALIGLIYLICVVYVFESFIIWQQVSDIKYFPLPEAIKHPHGLRYLLVMPAIKIADYLDLRENQLFGLFVAVNITLTAMILGRVQAMLTKQANKHWSTWFCFFFPIFAMLSIAMNGRLSYMLLGASLMIFASMRWLSIIEKRGHPMRAATYCLLNMLALFFLSVSSGCLTVGMVTMMMLAVSLMIIPSRGRLLHVLFAVITFIPYIMIQSYFVRKNLVFYDGSIILMLLHGPGSLIVHLNPPKLLLAAAVATIGFAVFYSFHYVQNYIQKSLRVLPLLLMIACASVIGVFGYSSLLTGLAAGLTLVLHVGYLAYMSPGSRQEKWLAFKAYWRMEPHKKPALIFPAGIALALFVTLLNVLPNDWKSIQLKEYKYEYPPQTYEYVTLVPTTLYPIFPLLKEDFVAPDYTAITHYNRPLYKFDFCAKDDPYYVPNWLKNPLLRYYRFKTETPP